MPRYEKIRDLYAEAQKIVAGFSDEKRAAWDKIVNAMEMTYVFPGLFRHESRFTVPQAMGYMGLAYDSLGQSNMDIAEFLLTQSELKIPIVQRTALDMAGDASAENAIKHAQAETQKLIDEKNAELAGLGLFGVPKRVWYVTAGIALVAGLGWAFWPSKR
jgi:hypothetical protein